MEELTREGRVRLLGVSNVSLEQLALLCASERIAPAFVQNRCYASHGWDRGVRAFCRARGIVYQGFSLLTANGAELAAPQVQAIARRLGATVPQVVFRFALAAGMLPLTGTSDREHMAQDLASAQLALAPDELATLEGIGD
jgi:diketogulonate reductase-like aldo/keto reductase